MTRETIDAVRGATYEVAEAIAPTWERRRADIEEVSTPVREWMLHVLRPREGDTVLELGAGVGDRREVGRDQVAALADDRASVEAGTSGVSQPGTATSYREWPGARWRGERVGIRE
jgi:hypothetical protein